jgi:hypothetical protein
VPINDDPPVRRLLRSGTDFAAGLFLLACAAFTLGFGQTLPVGTAFRMGPGYVPVLLGWVIAAFGVALVLMGLRITGQPLARWRFKPMVLVLGAMVVFALTIETAGLLIASASAVVLSSLGGPNPRVHQIALLAACLAGFACLLFPFALQLPLRIVPW